MMNLTPKNKEILILGTLLVLGLATRFFNIGFQSIWIDEGSTFYFTRYSLSELMDISEPNSPFYYLLEGVSLGLFGQTELGLRFTSAAAGALAVPLAYMVSMRLFRNRPAALAASALFLLSPILLFYGQEGRGYMIVACLFLIQILVMLKALETGRNLWWAIFAVLSAVQFTMQYSGIIATFTLYLYILCRCCMNGLSTDRYRTFIQMIWSGVLYLVMISPLVYKYLTDKGVSSDGYERWSWCFVGIEYTINHLNDLLFGFGFSAVLFILSAVGLYLCHRDNRDAALMLGMIMLFPLVFMTLFSLMRNVTPRYVLWSVTGFYLVIPFFLSKIDIDIMRTKKAIIAVSAVLVILAACILPVYYTEVTKEDFRTGAKVLEENAVPGDLVMYAVASENPVYASISFYYDPAKDGIDTMGLMSKEELISISESGLYDNIYVLILADYEPLDYLLHLESPNCQHICDAYRINVFRISGPLPL